MASTYLYRTQVAGTSTKKMTFSAWVRKADSGSYSGLLNCYTSNNDRNGIYFGSNDRLIVYFRTSGTGIIYYETTRIFRDPTAFIHVAVSIDSTLSTAGDRVRIYVNGVEETAFESGAEVAPGQDTTFSCIGQNNLDLEVGRMQYGSTTTAYFNGVMSHVHFVDGTAYPASKFGETDSTTGEWKIITEPTGITYGNNGFFILKDDNSNLDRSGEGHNQTIGGTLTFTHDNPSNVFCTLNDITGKSKPTLSLGNTKTGSSSDGQFVFGTMGSKAGYYEIKLGQNPNGSNGNGLTFGTFDSNYGETTDTTSMRKFKTNHAYSASYSIDVGNGSGTNTGVSAAAGDIISVAWKNGKLYVAKNGTYFFSANPSNNTDGSTQVLLHDSTAYQLPISKSNIDGMTNSEWNFGNGYFGTTAITSNSGNGYQDANGQGKFQYQPPTGCYALCTKNLNL